MLAALGLDPAEEEMYRRLVTRASLSVAELATVTGHSSERTAELLAGLVRRGLAVSVGPAGSAGAGGPVGADAFSAAPPAVALGGLLRQYRDDLHVAEQELAALADVHRLATLSHAAGGVVEVITDVDAVRHRYMQLQQAARHQVRSMVVPNLTVVPGRQNEAGNAALNRGVHYRAIVDRAMLAEPGFVEQAVCSIPNGEEIRIADQVPVKLVIADEDRAMLPLPPGQNTGPASILVHASGLLDALIAYFEMAWERAYPLLPNATGDGLLETRPADLDDLDARVLSLLLAGLTDHAVASQLGMSLRTVQRRIRVLLDKAGAETRIQLGWHAARKGWV